jgi:hypothetical protein
MERLVFVVLRKVLAKACFVADADVATRLGVLSKGDRCCFTMGTRVPERDISILPLLTPDTVETVLSCV